MNWPTAPAIGAGGWCVAVSCVLVMGCESWLILKFLVQSSKVGLHKGWPCQGCCWSQWRVGDGWGSTYYLSVNRSTSSISPGNIWDNEPAMLLCFKLFKSQLHQTVFAIRVVISVCAVAWLGAVTSTHLIPRCNVKNPSSPSRQLCTKRCNSLGCQSSRLE